MGLRIRVGRYARPPVAGELMTDLIPAWPNFWKSESHHEFLMKQAYCSTAVNLSTLYTGAVGDKRKVLYYCVELKLAPLLPTK